MEVWLHRTSGETKHLAAQETTRETGEGELVVDLSDYDGESVLLSAALRGANPRQAHWSAAELRAAPGPWFRGSSDSARWRLEAPDGSPNVIVYLVDALRADALGFAGGSAPTPNFDRLAREGATFTQAISTSSWTRAATGSLFTGLYASSHGAIGRSDVLPEGAFTLAERFRMLGYDTLGVIANGNVHAFWGFGQGFAAYVAPARPTSSDVHTSAPRAKAVASEVHAKALAMLRARSGRSRPLFLYLQVVDTHAPYYADPWLLDVERPGLQMHGEFLLEANQKGASAQTLRDLETLYQGAVAAADLEFGRFRAALDPLLKTEATVWLLTADHGEAFGEHRRVGHGLTLHEEEIRIPLVVSGRGRVPEGIAVAVPASLVDVLPTLLRISGVPAGDPLLAGVQGTDLSVVWREQLAPARAYVGAELRFEHRCFRSVRFSSWKLIKNCNRGVSWLFNVNTDPKEHTNLARSRPHIAAQLNSSLEDWVQQLAAISLPTGGGSVVPADAELMGNLRALGYVQ